MNNCKLSQVNDEVFCSNCAKVWGVDEPKPDCTIDDQRKRIEDNEEERKRVGREMIKNLKRSMS
jgi:hypothetical protein